MADSDSVIITVNRLIRLTNNKLGGYANAASNQKVLDAIQEGINEAWSVLKELKKSYSVVQSQATDAAKGNYFGPLDSTHREYTLPKNFQDMQFIEVTTPGYEDVKFIRRSMESIDFQEARRATTQSTAGFLATFAAQYIYDIVGKDQFVMAQYPEAALTLRLWYVRYLAPVESNTVIDEILFPYADKIAIYAAKVLTLSFQDQSMSAAWRQEWRDGLVTMTSAAGSRDSTTPQYVADFIG